MLDTLNSVYESVSEFSFSSKSMPKLSVSTQSIIFSLVLKLYKEYLNNVTDKTSISLGSHSTRITEQFAVWHYSVSTNTKLLLKNTLVFGPPYIYTHTYIQNLQVLCKTIIATALLNNIQITKQYRLQNEAFYETYQLRNI